MRSAPFLFSADPDRAWLPRRAVPLVLTIVAHLLLLLMLLRLAPPVDLPKAIRSLTLITLPPEPKPPSTPSRTVKPTKQGGGGRPAKAPKPTDTAKPPPPEATRPLQMMIVTREVFAASDIGKLPSRRDAGTPAAGGEGTGDTGEGTSDGPGKGPGGEKLYNADWYRRPTNAELAFYLPKRTPARGKGEIACRTAKDFRVEDCVELDESPPGSGLARAVRQAAWQFRVLPPRIGGRPLVGAWVRIIIDYSEQAEAR